ncbi:response regulator [Pseudanabaena biceps]|nr:response regulator [Pseudanabaena biceps]
MTQLSPENNASNLPTGEASIPQQQIVPVGEVVPNLSYSSLMVMLKSLTNQTGIAKVETAHLSWKLLVYSGSLVLIEEKNEFLHILTRKLKAQKVQLNLSIWKSLSQPSLGTIDLCQLLSEIYESDRENVLIVFKEILFENLLAISLEKNFSLRWKPISEKLSITLPTWQIADLEKAITKATEQWRSFVYARHPYQTVQILDTDCAIAQVPLFTEVTNGKYRISEVADRFKQHINQTALKLDKLAESRTVAILPLPKRLNDTKDLLNLEESLDEINPKRSQPKVMIIDDSPVLLKQFGNLITSWGYQLKLVNESSLATLEMLTEKPNIVFIDINMPNLNGFDLIKQIRRQPSLSTLPLVLVTSENSITNNFRAKWANCRFLGKPRTSADILEFREQVKAILQEFAPITK